MPVIAVMGAYMGASALAAGGLTAFGTIAAIGSIVSGIGALTGNESMMKIGGIAALAGGVGAFAQGQGWIGGDAGAGEASNIKAMTNTTAPGMESVNPSETITAGQAGMGGAEGATAGMESGMAQNITQTNSLASGAAPGGGLIDATSPTVTNAGFNPGNMKPVALTPQPTVTGSSVFDKLKSFSKFLEENKGLASIAGNAIGGMFDEEKKAKAEYYATRSELERQQMINGSAVPNLALQLKPKETIFRPGAPTYSPPRPSSLFYAK